VFRVYVHTTRHNKEKKGKKKKNLSTLFYRLVALLVLTTSDSCLQRGGGIEHDSWCDTDTDAMELGYCGAGTQAFLNGSYSYEACAQGCYARIWAKINTVRSCAEAFE
jgi:hypothetical protein